MRVLVDQDEVLCQFVARAVEWFNQDHGTHWTVDDVRSWRLQETFGADSEIYFRNYMRHSVFYPNLEPMPGAVDGMKQLIADGHDVLIVTAVPKSATTAYDGKVNWLSTSMPFFDLKNFMPAQRKHLGRGDVLVDDGPHNLLAFAAAGGTSVVFDRPSNQDGLPASMLRARSWPEVVEIVRSLPVHVV